MNEYKRPYYILFNAITDAIKEIEKFNNFEARLILQKAQLKAEEEYISAEDSEEV